MLKNNIMLVFKPFYFIFHKLLFIYLFILFKHGDGSLGKDIIE